MGLGVVNVKKVGFVIVRLFAVAGLCMLAASFSLSASLRAGDSAGMNEIFLKAWNWAWQIKKGGKS